VKEKRVELGPYNRHAGYFYRPDEGMFILGNRHIVELRNGTLELKREAQALINSYEDFIVHELTHARQAQLEREHGWKRTRGDHRDLGWYAAVAEACPRYLGVDLPRSIWPTGPRTRKGTLTEVEMTHWPDSIRALVDADDPRLRKAAQRSSTSIDVQGDEAPSAEAAE
jgi:hypothetical protein